MVYEAWLSVVVYVRRYRVERICEKSWELSYLWPYFVVRVFSTPLYYERNIIIKGKYYAQCEIYKEVNVHSEAQINTNDTELEWKYHLSFKLIKFHLNVNDYNVINQY